MTPNDAHWYTHLVTQWILFDHPLGHHQITPEIPDHQKCHEKCLIGPPLASGNGPRGQKYLTGHKNGHQMVTKWHMDVTKDTWPDWRIPTYTNGYQNVLERVWTTSTWYTDNHHTQLFRRVECTQRMSQPRKIPPINSRCIWAIIVHNYSVL